MIALLGSERWRRGVCTCSWIVCCIAVHGGHVAVGLCKLDYCFPLPWLRLGRHKGAAQACPQTGGSWLLLHTRVAWRPHWVSEYCGGFVTKRGKAGFWRCFRGSELPDLDASLTAVGGFACARCLSPLGRELSGLTSWSAWPARLMFGHELVRSGRHSSAQDYSVADCVCC